MLPETIRNELSDDEKILFQSEKLGNEKAIRMRKKLANLILIGLDFFFLIFILTLIVDDIIEEGLAFFSSSFFIFLIVILIVFNAVFPLLFRHMPLEIKQDSYFIVTTKKIYLYTYSYEQKSDWYNIITLSSIKGLIFKKRKWDNDGDFGTIEFILENDETAFYTLKNVPNLNKFQNMIESILFSYGNVKEKWQALRNQPEPKFPTNIQISSKRINIISNTQRKYTKYLIFSPFILLFIIFITYLIVSFLFSSNLFLITYALIFASLMYMIFIIFQVRDKIIMKKRMSPKYTVLTLESDKLILKSDDSPFILPLNKSITLNYFKINKPSNTEIKWEENIEGISIKSSYDSKADIQFGPIDDFPKIFELLFYYFIIWKSEQGMLIPKEKLTEIQISNIIDYSEKEKPLIETKEESIKLEVPKETQEIEKYSVEVYDSNLTSIQNYLNPNEKILLSYRPKINLTKTILMISIAIIGIMLTIFSFTLSIRYPLFILFSVFIMLIPIIMCTFGLFMLPTTKLFKNSIFFFTDEKVIAKYSKYICITPYLNIGSIGHHRIKGKTSNLILTLTKPIESSPFMDKYAIILPKVPNDSDLMNNIILLKKKYSKINTSG